MLDIKLIGSRIKELRKQRGLTQNVFADELHVSFQAVSNWERGIAPPELENLMNIAAYFGVMVDDLLRPQNNDLFLGIDGGGTKTEFAVISSDGCVRKRFIRSGCNPNDIGFSKMAALITEGIGNILAEFQSVRYIFCGISGISTGNYAKLLYSDLKNRYPQIDIDIKNDSFNLFALCDGVEMAVISGTGSVVFVKDGAAYKRLGGWGYLLDVAGSAYDIGRDVLRAALREEDMKEEASLMSCLLRKKLNTSTVWEHVNTVYNEGKPYIAGLASVVFDAYQKGDKKAVEIIDKNAKALAELLNSGVKLYGARPAAIASGGIFEHYADIMTDRIGRHSDVKLIISKLPPIYGACVNAYSMLKCERSAEFYENFKKTY